MRSFTPRLLPPRRPNAYDLGGFMAMTIFQELLEDPRLAYGLTVDKYHEWIASGAIEEGAPYELLHGQLVHKIRSIAGEDPTTVGPPHATAITRLGDLSARFKRCGCHIRLQSPVPMPPFDEPEPDAAIVRGTNDDYVEHHPGAADVFCVIEVADASLPRDRGYKQQIYANAGIRTYIIINLADRVIAVYTQ